MTAKRALAYGALAWAIYVALRSLLQVLLPAHDWPSFIPQDLAVTALRLACGGACLGLARARWTGGALGLGAPAPLSRMAYAAAACALAAEFAGACSQRADWGLPHWMRAAELAIALAVAFNEEAGFRLLAQNGLRELMGRRAAVLISSLLFALMHLGYQPLFHLPKIFLLGLVFALLRDRGASFRFLVLLHFLMDAFYAASLAGAMESPRLYGLSAALAAAAALLAGMAPRRAGAGEGPLLFSYGSLMPGRPEAALLGVERRCDHLGRGSVPGRLGKRQGYPALLRARKRGERVEGTLLSLRDREFLGILDAYEGDAYERDKIEVQLENGARREAWVYAAA
jgi:membrane protease YdiL (CAAX protease family)/gamma-glutamylcyclotransferase (GGCT)/AIG2-like uncharacterized protein YtfP